MSHEPPDVGKLYSMKCESYIYKDAWAAEFSEDDDFAEIALGDIVLIANVERIMVGTWSEQWVFKVIHGELIGYLLTDIDWSKELELANS